MPEASQGNHLGSDGLDSSGFFGEASITGGITVGRTAQSLLDAPPLNSNSSRVRFQRVFQGQSSFSEVSDSEAPAAENDATSFFPSTPETQPATPIETESAFPTGSQLNPSLNVPAESRPFESPLLEMPPAEGGPFEGSPFTDSPFTDSPSLDNPFEVRPNGGDSESHPESHSLLPALGQTWVVVHGWNSSPSIFEETAAAIYQARGEQDTVLLLDWSEAAQNGGNGLSGLRSGGNYNAASWISSVADWATQALREQGISDEQAATSLNFVGHSLGSFISAEIAARFDQGVNSLFALDPASEFNSVTGFGYDFNNDGQVDRPARFDEVSRLSRAFVGALSPAGNSTVAGWAHESYEMNFGFGFREPGSEHRWVYETFAQLIVQEDAIANSIGVRNLEPVTDLRKDAFRQRHEGELRVDGPSAQVESLTVQSPEAGQDEVVYGTAGGDRLSGGFGRDQLLGGAGADELRGGSGDDVLVGGAGADELRGGSGRDRFDFSAGDGGTTVEDADVITDFSVGGRFRSAELIGLGAGLSLEQIVLETGTGEYAGDTLIRHGDEFLARLVGVGVGEVAIATHFTQLP